VRLLFDQNLSPQLPRLLAKDYPGSLHIRAADLIGGSDIAIRVFAQSNDLVIVSRDFDFVELIDLLGAPPKVIYIQGENLSAPECAERLIRHRTAIEEAFTVFKRSVYIVRD
jgi:predicted nuclease of predicted toxin-antitoxin system